MYNPMKSISMTTPAKLLTVLEVTVSGGNTRKKQYVDPENADTITVGVKTFGGTEKFVNDRLVLEDTATVVTWYRPDITAGCRLLLLDDNSLWEIIGRPEDVDRRHQYLIIKCRSVSAGA